MLFSFDRSGAVCRTVLVILAALTSAAPDLGAQIGPDASLGKPGPQDQLIEAVRGEPINIVLNNESKNARARIDFVLKDQPLYGELLSLPQIDPRNPSQAIITYRSDPDSAAEADTFTWYSRYAPNGYYSAPARVTIKLSDPAPVLEVSEQVYFGKTVVGQESVREAHVANVGNATFDKILEIKPPWRIIAPEDGRLTLKPGEQRMLELGFQPTGQGSSVFELSLVSGKSGTILLNGEGYLPFKAEPEAITLDYQATTRTRSANLTLYGLSPEDVIVSVHTDGRLSSTTGNRLMVQAGGKHEFQLSLPEKDAKAYDGFITLVTEGYSRQIKVSAAVSPAFIGVELPEGSTTINFGEVVPGISLSRAFRVHNVGGKEALIDVQLPPPFELVIPDDSNVVPPQSSRDFTILFSSEEGSPSALHRKELAIKSGQQNLKFDVSVVVKAPMELGSAPLPPGATALPALAGTDSPRNTLPKLRDPSTGQIIVPKVPEILQMTDEELDERRTPLGFLTEDLEPREYSNRVIPVPMFDLIDQRRTSLVIGWPLPSPNQRQFVVDMRMTRQNTETYKIDSVWIPWPDVEFHIDEENMVAATVSGLNPNTIYEMRIVPTTGDGLYAKPSQSLGIRTAMPIDWTWFERIVILSGIALLGWFGWRVYEWRKD